MLTSSISEWLNLLTRWFHVFAGIMWVGQTYYFTWLDGQLSKLEKAAAQSASAPPQLWMVHSGGFYTVQKQKSLGVSASQIHWFRWEAAMTWLSGMVLLVLVYYLGGALIDPDVANISQMEGTLIGLGVLAVGWAIYDFAVRSPIGRSERAFTVLAIIAIALLAWGLTHIFSGRGAYIHVGALFGTIMTLNVWMRILPNQRKMLAAAEAGTNFDPKLGAQSKMRTKHNTFLAVPTVFIMVSNHFPVASYGSSYNWEILVALVVAGWIAAGLIRRA
jgi:uncharacterized membrane protein